MDDVFKKLRNNKALNYSDRDSYALDLYASSPWYLPNLEVEQTVAQTTPRDEIHSLGGEMETYINKLESCNLCKDDYFNGSRSIVHQLSKLDSKSITVMFVGDGPRKSSEGDIKKDKCFVGAEATLLYKIIKAMKLSPSEHVTCLLTKCFIDSDSSEVQKELAANCLNHLLHEIALLSPKFVITLGAFATNTLLGTKERLSNIHGKFYPKTVPKIDGGDEHSFTVVPLFHPSFLLINPDMKRNAWTDLQKVMKSLGKN
ncbi:MAG: uracil-DNA glycosylase [Bacteriovoracaceae bacterium]|nr:uracil-DNA glycosylase [Bacteriovoracaceae bacterium]